MSNSIQVASSEQQKVSTQKTIGIVIPTYFEAAPVLKAFQLKKIESGLYSNSQIASNLSPSLPRLLLIISGVGMDNARDAASRLCENEVGVLVSAGFCGALVPELQVGDLVTTRWTTSRIPVRTKAERQTLARTASARAVDMESQAIVEVGTFMGVPIRILRVVSDTLEDDLSPLLGHSNTFSPIGIALRLLNPATWPLARRLQKNSQVATKKLVEVLREFISTADFSKQKTK